MNNSFIIGRLTRKPELKYTTTNKAVTTITVAVRKDENNTTFFNIEFWNKFAENICNYLDKGNLVYVEATVENNVYEKEGIKVYSYKFKGKYIHFLSNKKKEESHVKSQEEITPQDFVEHSNVSNEQQIDFDKWLDDYDYLE